LVKPSRGIAFAEKNLEAPVDPEFRSFAGVFEGRFGKSASVVVVFCWCKRGGMRGKRGEKTVASATPKNTPLISTFF
jgi:hypothetical protein